MKNSILSHLPPDHPWGQNLIFFDCTDSTNTRARELAKDGAPSGTVLIADRQTGGRGRLGRSFHSPAGLGLYLSVILRPRCRATELMHLTCAAAVAACRAVEATCPLECGIKWTNDLVHGRHKLGGILTELGLGRDGTVDYAVIGIGINCCHRREDFPEELQDMAASLSMLTGTPVDRRALAANLILALQDMDRELLTDQDAMMDFYRSRCITLGKEISLVRADGNVRHGKALSVDAEGALIVAFADGHTEAVSSGEVSVRGMYGYL